MDTSMTGACEATVLPASASSYYLWEPRERPVSVRLNLDVIDRLGGDVISKFADLTGRGSEVAGVLLGRTIEGNKRTFFIEDYELISCDYCDGPLFSLSDESKSRMVEQLLRLKTSSPHSVLGFFRSHTRKGLGLNEHDLALIRDYFAGPATVFLLIKPFAVKPSTGGFFIWEDGEICAEESYCQFPFKRAELVIRTPEAIVSADVQPPPVKFDQPRNSAPPSHKLSAEVAAPVRVPRTSADLQESLDLILRQITRDPAEKRLFSAGMDLEREQERWSRFALESSVVSKRDNDDVDPVQELPPSSTEGGPGDGWPDDEDEPPARTAEPEDQPVLVDPSSEPAAPHSYPIWVRCVWASLFALFVLGGGYLGAHLAHSSTIVAGANNVLGLTVDSDGGGLVLRWNRASNVIATARNAILRIQDSSQSKDFDLNLEQLRFGKIVYFPTGESVNFRLEVIDSEGSRSVSEWVRATGRFAVHPSAVPQPATENRPKHRRKAA